MSKATPLLKGSFLVLWMLRSPNDVKQKIQKALSYKEVTKIYNEANYSNFFNIHEKITRF